MKKQYKRYISERNIIVFFLFLLNACSEQSNKNNAEFATEKTTEVLNTKNHSNSENVNKENLKILSLNEIRKKIIGDWDNWFLDANKSEYCGRYLINDSVMYFKNVASDTTRYRVDSVLYIKSLYESGKIDTVFAQKENAFAYMIFSDSTENTDTISFYHNVYLLDYVSTDTLIVMVRHNFDTYHFYRNNKNVSNIKHRK